MRDRYTLLEMVHGYCDYTVDDMVDVAMDRIIELDHDMEPSEVADVAESVGKALMLIDQETDGLDEWEVIASDLYDAIDHDDCSSMLAKRCALMCGAYGVSILYDLMQGVLVDAMDLGLYN